MAIIESVYESEGHWLGTDARRINYELCKAIDPMKISLVLKEMVEVGMEPQLAKIYETQANALLAALRSENNRLAKLANN